MEVNQSQKVETSQRTWTIDWHPKGDMLISAGSGKDVTIWHFEKEKLSKQSTITTQHSKTIRSVKFSHKADKIAVGSFDATISVWVYNKENNQYENLSTLQGHENQVKCVSWSPNDQKIASCSRDRNIWIWDFDKISYDYVCDSVLEGHTQDVKFVDWFPEQQGKLVSASYDNTIRIWEREDDDYFCKQVLQGHQSIVWNVQITKKYLFSASQDCSIMQWELNQQQQKYALKWVYEGIHSLPIYSLCIFQQNFLISGGGDNSICFSAIVKEAQQQATKKVEAKVVCKIMHESDVNCIKMNPQNQKILASCSDDQTIRIWKIASN